MTKFKEQVMRIFKGEGAERKKVLEPLRKEEKEEMKFTPGQKVRVPRDYNKETGQYGHVDELDAGWEVAAVFEKNGEPYVGVHKFEGNQRLFKRLKVKELAEYNE